MEPFICTTYQSRIVFGSGTVASLPDEVARLGGRRVLLIASSRHLPVGDRALGDLIVARFADAAMHTPVEVTEQALRSARTADVDCVVAIGGGSTTGLAKALAAQADYAQIIVPTTYAGSEVTPVLGETANGIKTTRSGAEILPETVIYDVDLTLGLPAELTLVSSINALAHAVEALYAADANPATSALAIESVARIGQGLAAVHEDSFDAEGRADLLAGAWLAGTCLASVGMGLHHKLCHTLGGSFGLPHAQTHAVMLPQAMRYNATAASDAMAAIADALGVVDAPAGVFDLVVAHRGPTSLASLGFTDADIPRAVEIALNKQYPNPAVVTAEGLAGLLANAVAGRRP